jgi:1-acyl-sn-glycerol-3-phosphate acyltransferase
MMEPAQANLPGLTSGATPLPRSHANEQVPACPAPGALATLLYELFHIVGMATFTLGLSFRYAGTRNIPKTGPVLVIANHQSFIDPMIVGMAVKPRRLTYLARKTLFINPWFASVIHSLNAVPIDQEGVGKEGLQTTIKELGLGKAVLVFPEGSRTPDGLMHPFRPGIHLLLKRSKATIVPVGIAGAYEAWPIWRNLPIPAPLFWPAHAGTVAVSIGKPLAGEKYAAMSRDQCTRELFAEIQQVQARAERLRRQ